MGHIQGFVDPRAHPDSNQRFRFFSVSALRFKGSVITRLAFEAGSHHTLTYPPLPADAKPKERRHETESSMAPAIMHDLETPFRLRLSRLPLTPILQHIMFFDQHIQSFVAHQNNCH